MGLNKWDIGIAYVRFDENTDDKVRPVLIVNIGNNNIISFKITTRFRSHILEYPIKQWRQAGLDKPSCVRLRHKAYFTDATLIHKIGTLQRADIECIEKLCQDNNIKLTEHLENNSITRIIIFRL